MIRKNTLKRGKINRVKIPEENEQFIGYVLETVLFSKDRALMPNIKSIKPDLFHLYIKCLWVDPKRRRYFSPSPLVLVQRIEDKAFLEYLHC